MTNVVPFRKGAVQRIPIACYLTIQPDAPLEEGRLMAYRFRDSEVVFVDWYWGRSGRGNGGRFCRPGDPREIHWVGSHFGYNDDNVANGSIVILGRVVEPNMMFAR